ncbi:FAD-binding oxidoreductase, partial [Mycobacterium tuberculosis]
MKRIAIVGAGQSGLQLGLGLLAAGYEVTMFSNRTGEDIRQGKVMSSQCMFHTSLQIERDLGLDHWASVC